MKSVLNSCSQAGMRSTLLILISLSLAACELFYDPATRLAYAIEAQVSHLGGKNGARYTIRYELPSELADSGGSYSVQFDQVGALIVWYKDANGKVTESASTSYYSRFVTTPRTFKLDKPGSTPLLIDLERQGGRAVIVDVR